MERECNFAAAAACICHTCASTRESCCCGRDHLDVYCPAFGIGIDPQRCPDYEERRDTHDEM